MSSSTKVVRAAQNLVINQFMTKEAISSTSYRPPMDVKPAEPAKINLRIHDESTHLKFGFPKTSTKNSENVEEERERAFGKI